MKPAGIEHVAEVAALYEQLFDGLLEALYVMPRQSLVPYARAQLLNKLSSYAPVLSHDARTLIIDVLRERGTYRGPTSHFVFGSDSCNTRELLLYIEGLVARW